MWQSPNSTASINTVANLTTFCFWQLQEYDHIREQWDYGQTDSIMIKKSLLFSEDCRNLRENRHYLTGQLGGFSNSLFYQKECPPLSRLENLVSILKDFCNYVFSWVNFGESYCHFGSCFAIVNFSVWPTFLKTRYLYLLENVGWPLDSENDVGIWSRTITCSGLFLPPVNSSCRPAQQSVSLLIYK